MKSFTLTLASSLLILFVFIACNNDDDSIDLSNENFLSAKINGVDYRMDSGNSKIIATRIIGASGISKLKLEALSADGQVIRLMIPEYTGKNLYLMGGHTMLPNIIEYEKASPFGHWLCDNPGPNEVEKNFVEIMNDDGNFIDGNFNFYGQNFEDNSILKITDGKFRVWAN